MEDEETLLWIFDCELGFLGFTYKSDNGFFVGSLPATTWYNIALSIDVREVHMYIDSIS